MKVLFSSIFRQLFALLLLIFFVGSSIYGQGVLRGKIYDYTSKEGIPYVNIYIPELNIVSGSDSSGTFIIKNLPNGNYNIQLSHIEYESSVKNIQSNDTIQFLEIFLKPGLLDLPEVVIYGSQNNDIKKTSFNITSLSQKEMKENGTYSISDAVSRIPGMSQISTGVGISKPVIRGLYGNRIQTVLMGMRFDNQQWQDEHGLGISDVGVDRIEIIKGPASLLYGSEAIGGILNIIEEKPAELGKTKIDLNTQFFSNTLGNATNLGIKKSTEKRSWRVRGGYETQADYSDGNGNRVLNSRFGGYHLKSSLEYHSSKRVTIFNFMTSYSNFGFIMDGDQDRKVIDARWNRKLDGPKHDVFFNIATVQNTFFREKAKIKVNLGAHSNLRQENEGGNRISLNMLLNTLAYDVQWIRSFGRGMELTIGNQSMFQTNRNYGSRTIVPDANLWEAGVFTYLKKSLQRITLEAGLRYDHKSINTFLTDPINTNSTLNPAPDLIPVSKSYNVINGSTGTSIVFLKSWNYKFNVSSGYRAPNLAELSSNGLHEGSSRWEIGNTNMKVEQNLNFETSMNYEVRELSVTAALYRNRLLNYIYLAPTGTQFTGFNIYRYIQNTSTIKGGELILIYNPAWLKVIKFTSSYSFIDGRTDGGNHLPFIPANRFLGELRFNLKGTDRISKPYIKGGMTYVLSQNKPAQFETATSAYNLLNAGIGGTLLLNKTPLEVALNCNNLLNKLYYDHLSRFKYYGIYNIGRNITLNIHIPIK